MGERKPKTKIQKLRDQADKEMSLAVRSLGYCERCGTTENLQHHHVVEKSNSNNLRYDFDNALCFCRGCHKWWHTAGTLTAADWFQKKYGIERWDRLIEKGRVIVKTNTRFYESAIEHIRLRT